MGALLAREFERAAQRPVVDLLGDARRQVPRGGGVERQPQREEDVLQAHAQERPTLK